MRNLIPALILTLGGCIPTMTQDRPIAGAVQGQPATGSPTPNSGETSAPPDGKATSAPTVKPPEIDATRRFEYAEVTVDLGDPVGMRALVPYLLKPETWTLVKCEMVSTTSKYYKFQKVTSNDGRSLPDVDVFKGRR